MKSRAVRTATKKMGVAKKTPPSSVVPRRKTKPVEPMDAATTGPSHEMICTTISERVRDFETRTIREMFEIADLFASAKTAYEAETKTGHGKRNPEHVPAFVEVTASAIGRSTSYVQKFCTVAGVDAKSRASLLELADGSFRLLLAVGQEPDLDKRLQAVIAFQQGGMPAVKATLGKSPTPKASTDGNKDPIAMRYASDPAFATLIGQMANPKEILGGIAEAAPDSLVPDTVTSKYAELKGKTYTDVFRALAPLQGSELTRPHKKPKQPTARAPVNLAIRGGEEKECKLGRTTLRWATTAVRVSGNPVTLSTVEIDFTILDYSL